MRRQILVPILSNLYIQKCTKLWHRHGPGGGLPTGAVSWEAVQPGPDLTFIRSCPQKLICRNEEQGHAGELHSVGCLLLKISCNLYDASNNADSSCGLCQIWIYLNLFFYVIYPALCAFAFLSWSFLKPPNKAEIVLRLKKHDPLVNRHHPLSAVVVNNIPFSGPWFPLE